MYLIFLTWKILQILQRKVDSKAKKCFFRLSVKVVMCIVWLCLTPKMLNCTLFCCILRKSLGAPMGKLVALSNNPELFELVTRFLWISSEKIIRTLKLICKSIKKLVMKFTSSIVWTCFWNASKRELEKLPYIL